LPLLFSIAQGRATGLVLPQEGSPPSWSGLCAWFVTGIHSASRGTLKFWRAALLQAEGGLVYPIVRSNAAEAIPDLLAIHIVAIEKILRETDPSITEEDLAAIRVGEDHANSVRYLASLLGWPGLRNAVWELWKKDRSRYRIMSALSTLSRSKTEELSPTLDRFSIPEGKQERALANAQLVVQRWTADGGSSR